jgi:hypothetical protein
MIPRRLIAVISVAFSLFAGGLVAAELDRHNTELDQKLRPGLIYLNKAFNNAIYSYLAPESIVFEVKNPQIVYVNKAYGQSIYSYPRVGPDRVTAFNVQYVSPAYGQAIYSYPGNYNLPGRLTLSSWVD